MKHGFRARLRLMRRRIRRRMRPKHQKFAILMSVFVGFLIFFMSATGYFFADQGQIVRFSTSESLRLSLMFMAWIYVGYMLYPLTDSWERLRD